MRLSPILCATMAFLVLSAVSVLTVAVVLALRPHVAIVVTEQ